MVVYSVGLPCCPEIAPVSATTPAKVVPLLSKRASKRNHTVLHSVTVNFIAQIGLIRNDDVSFWSYGFGKVLGKAVISKVV